MTNEHEKEICVAKDPWRSNSILLDVYIKKGGSFRIEEIFAAQKYLDKPYDGGYWLFDNDEEFAAIIEIFTAFIMEIGLEKIKQLEADIFEPTFEMYQDLFENHDKLAAIFMKKNGVGELNSEEVEKFVIKKAEETFEKEFDDIKVELIELAAYFGNQIKKEYDGIWEFNKLHQICYVDLPKHMISPQNTLRILVYGWKKKNVDNIAGRMQIIAKHKIKSKLK